ncbi:unnamed protein product, partial [Rotaria sp. Silwood2]
MFAIRLKYRRNPFKQILSIILFILFHWNHRIHIYLFFITLFTTSFISYRQPFSLLFQESSSESVRNNLINQHKEEQKNAFKWIENILKHPENHSNLISKQTQQSIFYDYL